MKSARLSLENPVTKYYLLDQMWCNYSGGYDCLSDVINYDLSDHIPRYYTYEIPEKIQDHIWKSRPLHLESCINKFVYAVSRIPDREIWFLQNPSEAMSSFLDTICITSTIEWIPIRKNVIKKRSKFLWLSQDLLYRS